MVCGEDCVGVFVQGGLIGNNVHSFEAVQVYSKLYINKKKSNRIYIGHSKLGPEVSLQGFKPGRSIVDLLFSETGIHLKKKLN